MWGRMFFIMDNYYLDNYGKTKKLKFSNPQKKWDEL